MNESSETPFVINRIGYVSYLGAMHFMAGHDGDRTACGRTARHTETCTKERGILAVECGSCWKIKRSKAGA